MKTPAQNFGGIDSAAEGCLNHNLASAPTTTCVSVVGRLMNAKAKIHLFLCGLICSCLVVSVEAFPPAPHHQIHGLVRDELGNPLAAEAEIQFVTTSGRTIATTLDPNLAPGVNYRLEIPMEAGLTGESYHPTAMRPNLPFTIRVKIGTAIYLPIEMSGSAPRIGHHGETSVINLTLGVDSDNDGLPDAWEQTLIDAYPHLNTLADVKPDADDDGDKLSNRDEYISGNYAFDAQDEFDLAVVGVNNGVPIMQFRALRGRTYTVYASENLGQWTAIPFRIPAETDASLRNAFPSTDVRDVRIETPQPDGAPQYKFFRLRVQ